MSSKLSFRSRQVDYMKPLPIFMSQDLPDLADVAAINRSVPQMPTGMENDEECEHHLQRALSALQAFGAVATTSSSEYAIPTPKVDAIDDKVYENIYSIQLPKLLKQYIRIQPFSNDYDYPDYDADVDDEAWLNEERNKLGFACEDLVLFFENVMDRLEKVTGHSTNIMSREEAKILLTKESDDLAASCFSNSSSKSTPLKSGLSAASDASKKQRDEFVMCIYEYWKAKRLKYKHPLTPTVLTDKSGVVTQPNNPYLVFRRRTEKMQTRKNRKTEEQSYEKMLILKRDLLKAQQILKFIKQRESMKKELVKMAMEGFEKRFKLNDYDGHVTESIKASLKPASSAAQANNYYANAALSALANSSNSHSLMNFHNRINNINKSAAAAASAAGVQSSIERTIAMIGSSSSSTSAANKLKSFTTHLSNNNFKRNNDQYDTTTVNNNNKKQRNKDRNRTSSSQQHVNNLEQQQQVKKASPPQAGSALFKKPPSLTVNQLTQQQQQQQQQQQTSMSTKNRLIRRLTSQRSSVEGDQQQQVSAVANSETAATKAANYFLVECNEYDEELRLNEINNLDALLTETQNKLSTSVDKDGYWCFKRKEGCKYLAQNGSIFKNDALDYFSELNKTSNAALVSRLTLEEEQNSSTKTMRTTQSTSNTSSELNTSKKRKRARELQHYYCGYAMDAALNRHLGLVRRRMGRGGRVLLERVRPEAVEKLAAHQDDSTTIASSTSTVSTSPPQSAPLSQDAFASFKTYYPIESAAASLHTTADGSSSTIFAVVPNINSKRLKLMEDDTSSSSEEDEKDEKESGVGGGKPSELTRYDHRLYLTHSYEFESYGRHPSEDEEEDDDDDESILSEDEEDDEEEEVDEEDEEFVMHEDGRRVRMRSTKPVNDEHRRLDDESMIELDESRRREALRALVGLRRPQTDSEARHEDERTGNNEPSSSLSSSQQQQIHAPIKIEPSPKRSSPSPPTPPPSSSSSSSSQTSTPVVMTCNGYPSSPINFSGQTNSGKLQQSVNNHQSEQLIVNKIVNNSSSISSSVFYSAASSSSSNEPVVVSSSTPTSNGSTASSQQPSNGPPAKVLGNMMKESSQSQLASTNHNHHATTNPTYQLANNHGGGGNTSPSSSSPATNNSSTSTPTYNSNTNAYSTICSK